MIWGFRSCWQLFGEKNFVFNGILFNLRDLEPSKTLCREDCRIFMDFYQIYGVLGTVSFKFDVFSLKLFDKAFKAVFFIQKTHSPHFPSIFLENFFFNSSIFPLETDLKNHHLSDHIWRYNKKKIFFLTWKLLLTQFTIF